MHLLSDTICAPATPLSTGASLCIIRISGDKTLDVFSKISIPSPPYEERRIILGSLFYIGKKKKIDQAQWVYYKGPRSYTGEDMIEIFTHGGILIPRLVLGELIKAGARFAEPGEFTLRAVLNSKIDPIRAQAVDAMVKASSLKALEIAIDRLEGKLTERFSSIYQNILNVLSEIEVNINYPEEDLPPFSKEKIFDDIESIKNSISQVLEHGEKGKKVEEGLKIAICGEVNVGKSTLFNRILKEERAITSSIPGTTRDFLKESILLGGINVSIFDLAGIRVRPRSTLEKRGIEKTLNILEEADIVILIFDASKKPSIGKCIKKNLFNKKEVIYVINKIDRDMRWDPDKYEILKGKRVIKISALKGYNFDIFLKEVEERIKKLTGEVFFSISLYEKSLLREIFEFLEKSQDNIEQDELSALYLKMALNRLSKLLGKDTDEELLRNIFKNFCVGK